MTKLEQLVDLRKKKRQAYKNWFRQVYKVQAGKNVRVQPTFWYQVHEDYCEQIETLKRKIGPGDY